MVNQRFQFGYLMLFELILVTSSSSQRIILSTKNHIALFIFGDSLFDTGNNNYLQNAAGRANFYPYGETFFKYPTGRFSDGRLIPDFIADYLNLPLMPPYLQPGNHQFTEGANFASAGAGALVDTYPGLVIDLKSQLSYFKNVEKQLRKKLGDKESKELVAKAIFIFSIGGNDYAEPFATNSTVLHHFTTKQYVDFVIGNFSSVLQEIYRIGGRKFGFINVGSLAALPSIKAFDQHFQPLGILGQVSALVKRHNKTLLKLLRGLNKDFNGFQYSHFDFYKALNNRINKPSKYGFKEGKIACCGGGIYRGVEACGAMRGYELCENPSEYVFFDGGHPTDHFNHQIANLMFSGSPKLAKPYNLQALLNTESRPVHGPAGH